MQCDRKGCENIMCDRYSLTHGYICYDCYEELINSDKPIVVFMNTRKTQFNNNSKTSWEEYLESEFRLSE